MKLMGRKKIPMKSNSQQVLSEQQSEKSNTLIFCGVVLAISSIGLLIFVLTVKVFHLS